MAKYEFRVTSDNAEEIVFILPKESGKKDSIYSANISILTNDKLNLNKSQSIRAEVQVLGVINKDYKKQSQLLADWAIATKKDLLYRTVEIKLFDAEAGDILRRYIFDNMYVVDYHERTGGNGKPEEVEFDILLRQKEEYSTRSIKPQ